MQLVTRSEFFFAVLGSELGVCIFLISIFRFRSIGPIFLVFLKNSGSQNWYSIGSQDFSEILGFFRFNRPEGKGKLLFFLKSLLSPGAALVSPAALQKLAPEPAVLQLA